MRKITIEERDLRGRLISKIENFTGELTSVPYEAISTEDLSRLYDAVRGNEPRDLRYYFEK